MPMCFPYVAGCCPGGYFCVLDLRLDIFYACVPRTLLVGVVSRPSYRCVIRSCIFFGEAMHAYVSARRYGR